MTDNINGNGVVTYVGNISIALEKKERRKKRVGRNTFYNAISNALAGTFASTYIINIGKERE